MWPWIWAALCVGLALLLQTALHEQHPHPGQTMCDARSVGLVVVGDGSLSQQLLSALEALNETTRAVDFCGASFHVAAVGSNRGFIKHTRGLSWEHIHAIKNHTISGNVLSAWEGLDDDEDLTHKETLGEVVHEIVGHYDKCIIVDCSTDAHIEDLVVAKRYGMGLVLANIHILAGPWKQFHRLVYDEKRDRPSRLVAIDAAIGKGLPVLSTLHTLHAAGDFVTQIKSTFSDAVGHVLAEMDKGASWSDSVTTVYENGLTEDDPRDDLTGLVLARKAVVVARQLGLSVELSFVEIESLIPSKMKNGTLHEFFDHLDYLNQAYQTKWEGAKHRNEKLVYVARIIVDRGNAVKVRIQLESINSTHALHTANYGDSIAQIRSNHFPHGLILQIGRPDATGTVSAILADIAKLSCVLFTQCDL
ncbi:hypothetical protein LEN26_017593 [Aphanomyces euteiches]|nr:hypothetical protein LEN26_017593 [Aphanomyces euteiches]KAH9105992.1 hypothetical protein AeMF1_018287 [Aphanomyces euteiches]KAH9196978.1 hypothetical protein AeNC1_001057 [Aphanomyces euteiches]